MCLQSCSYQLSSCACCHVATSCHHAPAVMSLSVVIIHLLSCHYQLSSCACCHVTISCHHAPAVLLLLAVIELDCYAMCERVWLLSNICSHESLLMNLASHQGLPCNLGCNPLPHAWTQHLVDRLLLRPAARLPGTWVPVPTLYVVDILAGHEAVEYYLCVVVYLSDWKTICNVPAAGVVWCKHTPQEYPWHSCVSCSVNMWIGLTARYSPALGSRLTAGSRGRADSLAGKGHTCI